MENNIAVGSIVGEKVGQPDPIADFVREAEIYFALDTPLYWDVASKSTLPEGSTGPFIDMKIGEFMGSVAEVRKMIRESSEFGDLTPVRAILFIDALLLSSGEKADPRLMDDLAISSIIDKPITPSHELPDKYKKHRMRLLHCEKAVKSIEQGRAKGSDYELVENFLEVKKGYIGREDLVLANKLGRFRQVIIGRRGVLGR